MAHAETCPVCKGTGQLPFPDDVIQPKICHGCDGKGWIEVGDTIPPFPSPMILYPEFKPGIYYTPTEVTICIN